MGAHQGEHALQPVPIQRALVDQHAARKRRPMREGLPARAAEGEPRQRREHDRHECGDRNSQPAPVGDQHDRKQQTELRFVGEEPETDTGQRRMPLQQTERAADQRRGEEAVLPGGDVPDRGGKSEREQRRRCAGRECRRWLRRKQRALSQAKSPRRPDTAASPARRQRKTPAADNASRNSRRNRSRRRALRRRGAASSRRHPEPRRRAPAGRPPRH